ncbi:cyclic nucleotide-binding domain-containing protein [Rhizobium sp.]
MGLREDIDLLKGLSIFDGLSDDYLRLLAFGAERRRLENGHVLFREGASADSAFVVLSGRLTLTRDLPNGQDLVIGDADPGSILTEIAMISDANRHFTATASTESEVMRISRVLFHRMLQEYPEVAMATERRLRENFSRLTGALAAATTRLDH